MGNNDFVTKEYLDESIKGLREHVVSRLDKMEDRIVVGYRRDIDRIDKKSTVQDVALLIGTIVATVLGLNK